MKILIAIPSNDYMHAQCAMSLLEAVLHCSSNTQHCVNIMNINSSDATRSREEFGMLAIEQDYDRLLFIDSDMTLPEDAITRLLAHDYPIVCANYKARRGDNIDTARILKGLTPTIAIADRCGFGFCSIDVKVLKAINLPRFAQIWSGAVQEYIGHDYAFCYRAEKAGYVVHVDMELSEQIGHIGSITHYL